MLYTLILDKNNYVLSISHTSNDDVELDLEDVDLSHIGAYKFTGGKLVLDEDKKEELIEEETAVEKAIEITELKEYLISTSDVDNDFIEQLFSLNNPLTFVSDLISLMSSYKTTYKTILSERKKARDRLKELESH